MEKEESAQKNQGPSTKVIDLIPKQQGRPRYEGRTVYTKVATPRGLVCLQTEKPLQEMHSSGERLINWKNVENTFYDELPIYRATPQR